VDTEVIPASTQSPAARPYAGPHCIRVSGPGEGKFMVLHIDNHEHAALFATHPTARAIDADPACRDARRKLFDRARVRQGARYGLHFPFPCR